MIAERGWRAADVDAVALAAGIDRIEFLREFDGLHDVLIAAARRADAAMFEEAASLEPGEPARDRLFAVLMRRFEAASSERPALKALVRAAPFDPLLGAVMLRNLALSARRALEAAGVGAHGLAGLARAKALVALVLAPVIRVWLADDTPDLARTMAALDAALARYERLAVRLDPAFVASSPAATGEGSGASASSTRRKPSTDPAPARR